VSEGIRVEPRTGGAVVAGVLAALLFSAILLPTILGEAGAALALVAFVSPFPLAQARLRLGARAAFGGAALASVFLAFLFTPGHGAAFLLLLAAPVLLLAEAAARGRGLLVGCGWAATLIALQVALALVSAGPQVADALLTPMERVYSDEFLDGLREGGLPEDQVAAWETRFRSAHAALQVVYPAVCFIMGGLLVMANALLLRGYLARRRPEAAEAAELENLRWPIGLAVAFCALGGAVVVPLLRPVAYNGLLVLAFLYALQGLSVVGYYVRRLAGPPMLRAALLVLVLLNPWAAQILALVGLFDTWLEFRRWADPPEDAGEDEE
jgi:uncharacterized protein YybS (DUF2232 family)